jgi:NAD(P)-dependent dehydrogenase (short-subunit alcohol dehydrogenase family)
LFIGANPGDAMQNIPKHIWDIAGYIPLGAGSLITTYANNLFSIGVTSTGMNGYDAIKTFKGTVPSAKGYLPASIAASKAAIEGLSISLAAELSSSQIRVNIVAPSLTDTPLASKLLNTPEKMDASAKRHPLGKYGTPKDISAAIAFLLSAESSWITGQIIPVDGGLGNLKTTF